MSALLPRQQQLVRIAQEANRAWLRSCRRPRPHPPARSLTSVPFPRQFQTNGSVLASVRSCSSRLYVHLRPGFHASVSLVWGGDAPPGGLGALTGKSQRIRQNQSSESIAEEHWQDGKLRASGLAGSPGSQKSPQIPPTLKAEGWWRWGCACACGSGA